MGFAELLASADRVSVQLLGGSMVRYSPSLLGTYVDVWGLFDAKHQRVDVLGAPVNASAPAVFVQLADLAPFDPETDEAPTLTVGYSPDSTTYRVRETQKDGQGGAMLYLQEM